MQGGPVLCTDVELSLWIIQVASAVCALLMLLLSHVKDVSSSMFIECSQLCYFVVIFSDILTAYGY